MLAAPARMDRCRSAATPARGAAGQAQHRRTDRLVPRRSRRLPCPGGERRPKTGPSPIDRARSGSQHHLITDSTGIPLAATLTSGNRHDITQLIPLIDAVPPIRGRRGRPRQRPARIYADRAYDHDKYRTLVHGKGIQPAIARRGTEHGSGPGIYRWIVEHTFALLRWLRRLRIRWEHRNDNHETFLNIGCSIICWRRLKNNSIC